MTNKEAIDILENEKKCVNRANKNDECNRDCYNCELVKTDKEILNALDMAIQSLKQTQLTDGDRVVSLKAVMDIVSDMRDLCRQDVLQDTLKQLQQLPPVKLQPCEDAISRQAIIDMLNDIDAEVNDGCGYMYEYWMDYIKQLPSVTPERPKSRCKDCKFFEYDSIAKVDGVPLIVAHEICNRWGDGCKSREDGYCFLFEPREDGE